MINKFLLAFLVLAVLGLGFLLRTWQERSEFRIPSGKTETQKTIEEVEEKEILVTEGTKHSIPLGEIKSGGPGKDGIPSIDKPAFLSVKEAESFLKDKDPGIAINIEGEKRFYPFKIMVWHEIVNDTINEKRVLVTYCPLCLSGIVFDPLVLGERVEFGVSGKLWNSNLLMYDRRTDSLWSQVLGEAVVGEATGTKLVVIPSDIVQFGNWKKQNPLGLVLEKPTRFGRDYERDPYGDYYTTTGTYFPVNKKDSRLSEKDFVLGLVSSGKAKAYLVEAVKRVGKLEETFGGQQIVAQYEKEEDVVRIYEKKDDGTLERLNPISAFWFSWVSVHPETEVYK